MINRLLIVGDVHADTNTWLGIERARSLFDCDATFLVGDFGWGFGAETFENLSDYPIYWIEGNHENFNDLYGRFRYNQLEPQETAENIWWCPRGTVIELAGYQVMCFGGGTSIDRHWRVTGISWWQQEGIVTGEVNRALDNWRARPQQPRSRRLLLTHECPEAVRLFSPELMQSTKIDDPLSTKDRLLLDQVFDGIRPAHHFHGHWHTYHRTKVQGCWSIGLADLPPSNAWVLKNADAGADPDPDHDRGDHGDDQRPDQNVVTD